MLPGDRSFAEAEIPRAKVDSFGMFWSLWRRVRSVFFFFFLIAVVWSKNRLQGAAHSLQKFKKPRSPESGHRAFYQPWAWDWAMAIQLWYIKNQHSKVKLFKIQDQPKERRLDLSWSNQHFSAATTDQKQRLLSYTVLLNTLIRSGSSVTFRGKFESPPSSPLGGVLLACIIRVFIWFGDAAVKTFTTMVEYCSILSTVGILCPNCIYYI